MLIADLAQPRNCSIVSRLSFVQGTRDRLGTRLGARWLPNDILTVLYVHVALYFNAMHTLHVFMLSLIVGTNIDTRHSELTVV